MLQYRKSIESMRPYVPGKPIEDVQKEFGLTKVIKLASNENPYGCSEQAKQAVIDTMSTPSLYPDGNASKLRNTLSNHLSVSPNQLIFGAGSDEILTMLAQVFINPEDEVITCETSFPRYKSVTHLMNGKFIEIPLKNHTFDLNSIADSINENTKMIFIANPNNPTGTIVTSEEQENFLKKVPKNVIVVLDEAYYEYACGNEYPESIPLLKKYNNLIILRTFSKAYGLASLRVGYGISNESVIDLLNRVRGPFNITTQAQKAASSALKDQDFVKKCILLNNQVKIFAYEKCTNLGINYIPTYCNFIMIDTGKPSKDIFLALQKKGIIVRPGFYYGMNTYIRVTFGTMEQMELFFDELEKLI